MQIPPNSPQSTRKLPWCPPPNFVEVRGASIRTIRTSVITLVHGQFEITGLSWGVFLPGALLARHIHHHVGVLGFDKMYVNVFYNDTIHTNTPTVTEFYPEDKSCVAAWYATAAVEFRYVPFGGPPERWPVDEKGEARLDMDLYKTLRGINVVYDEIVKKNEADWVIPLDADEYLTPVNWEGYPKWCSHKFPSIMEQGIQQMLEVATTVDLQSYPHMIAAAAKGLNRSTSDACMLGYGVSTAHAQPACREISSIILPVRFWTKHYPNDGSIHKPRMPLLRANIHSSYAHNDELNRTELAPDSQYHQWKSIHQVRFTPVLDGRFTMHYGGADTFKIIAPRVYHKMVSFEIAHVQKDCDDECRSYLVKDEFLNDLSVHYHKCMASLKH